MFPLIGFVQLYEFSIASEVYQLNSMKISSQFSARLSQMNSQEKIRVVVFLQTETEGQRKSPQEIQKIAETQLDTVRPILAKYQGELLTESPNILGSIGIHITVAGVYALAESSSVKMIVEDQGIFSR